MESFGRYLKWITQAGDLDRVAVYAKKLLLLLMLKNALNSMKFDELELGIHKVEVDKLRKYSS